MKTVKIDIVSDVSCPWCIIGYASLNKALIKLDAELIANIQWHPFELNPSMPPEGQEINEHLAQKYGIDAAQIEQNRAAIQQRGLDEGYAFGERGGGRIYNTFDAHRLLHWAQLEGKQTELSLALFDLYFKERGNPNDHSQLLLKVEQVGLSVQEAKRILSLNLWSVEVRQQQQYYQSLGISSVPAIIINDKHLISGGQATEVFENALNELVLKPA